MYFCREVTRLKCAALLLVEKASMKVVRRFFFLKAPLLELYSLCLLKFAARPELCTFSVPLWRLPNIWCIHVWIHFPVVTDSMLYEKYWFWGKNMFYVHIILKLCFILSLNGRPMQMDNKYLETWPWFKCASLNCTIQFSMH